jgi:hypothetical protein
MATDEQMFQGRLGALTAHSRQDARHMTARARAAFLSRF